MQQNLTLEQRTMRSAGVLSSEVVFEGGVVPTVSHCPYRGRGSAWAESSLAR